MTHIRTLMDRMIQIDEGRMKDIFTADQEGKSAKEIAKALKLPLETVKKILGEENDLQEFSPSQLDVLARQYAGLSGKTISVERAAFTLVYVDAIEGWVTVNDSTENIKGNPFIVATGGTITTSGNDKIHTFTGPGTFTVCSVGSGPTGAKVDYVVIAGGGGSGYGDGSFTVVTTTQGGSTSDAKVVIRVVT